MELRIPDPALRRAQRELCRLVSAAGGRALLVGGCVRDAALGREAKDLDIEVYGLEAAALEKVLAKSFELDLVGKAFGVIKLRGVPVDVSLPRRESKTGLGHKAFSVLSDPNLPFAEAAARRDFTINAMGFDPLTGELLDPHGGLRDLERRLLRHTSDKFSEDPLRVLRGAQFAARFGLAVAPETIALCSGIQPEGLARERVQEEWRKLLLQGERPSLGLAFLKDCRWLVHFPELAALVDCAQDPQWHPEGDVWVHTLHALDIFARERVGNAAEDWIVGLGVLCHDLGKPSTTRFEEGRIRSRGHEEAGEAPTRSFLARLTNEEDIVEAVVRLVLHHLKPQMLFQNESGAAAVRRLAVKVGRIDLLVRVAGADHRGRPPKPDDGFPAGRWLLERAEALRIADSAPKHIVLGRHLIELGLSPGPRFGPILEACYEAQLDGVFATLEEGVAFARKRIAEIGG